MILDEQGMQRAKSLASDLVRVEKERKKLERARRARITIESFESLGMAIRNVHNAYIKGFYKPITKAMKAMGRGYHS